jgi:hypothetical protein
MVKVVQSEVSGLGFETPAGQIFALFPNGQNEKKPSQHGIEPETPVIGNTARTTALLARMSNKENVYL